MHTQAKRILPQQELAASVGKYQLQLVRRETVEQYFAASYTEYFEKIERRGLSSLLAISDAAFERGLKQFKEWVGLQSPDLSVREPVDLFVFSKMSA